ncbi:MAG: VIT1/CCC1 family protein [Candidatus Woesearchaeota archaeon]
MELILKAQKNEITEHFIYLNLSKKSNNENKKTLEKLASDELKHYNILKKHSNKDIKPDKFKIFLYSFLATIFGISFAIRLMEKGEQFAQKLYESQKHNDFKILLKDEHIHENSLIDILKDSRIEYAGSIVLGLNDALVELTGALAGLSLAIQNGRLIAIIGFITGFAASLSMAASAYLSSKEEESNKDKNIENKDSLKGALYTGIAYIITVLLLIVPFILIEKVILAMITMLLTTLFIIAFYTFYITTAKNTEFWHKFREMALISLSVALISFLIGFIVKYYFGVDV